MPFLIAAHSGCEFAYAGLPSAMVKRRTADDPWYTAIYREPHTFWWAPAVFSFIVIFGVAYYVGDSVAGASAWAAALTVAYAVIGYVGWRRSHS